MVSTHDIEAIVLTGGSSRRMGTDKAALTIEGERMDDRIVRLLAEHRIRATILGPRGKADDHPGEGPLRAISGFEPTSPWVLACSCDIPLFDARIAACLRGAAAGVTAVIPEYEGRLQPLMALYAAEALAVARTLAQTGERRVMAWIEQLSVRAINVADLERSGLDPKCILSANTPVAWANLLQSVRL